MSIGLILSALAAGVGIWFTSTTAFWSEPAPVELSAVLLDGEVREPFVTDAVTAIRSESSPLGFRACFTTPLSPATVAETYVTMDRAVPTVPPAWFDCFDANAIGAALQDGTAIAILSHKNIAYGVDRVLAVMPDGTGYAWHELNNCGRKAYDGSTIGETCPDRASFKGDF